MLNKVFINTYLFILISILEVILPKSDFQQHIISNSYFQEVSNIQLPNYYIYITFTRYP